MSVINSRLLQYDLSNIPVIYLNLHLDTLAKLNTIRSHVQTKGGHVKAHDVLFCFLFLRAVYRIANAFLLRK